MLFNALNLIFLNVTMLNCTKKIFTQISLAGLYFYFYPHFFTQSQVTTQQHMTTDD